MKKTSVLTKALALFGTLLVWLPIATPLVFAAVGWVNGRMLMVDYLMPLELFPLAAAGGGLLLWAALRARTRRAPIGGGIALSFGVLVIGQAIAVATGLASGEAGEPEGWALALIIAMVTVYTLAQIGVGVAGGLLVRDTFRAGPSSGQPVSPDA